MTVIIMLANQLYPIRTQVSLVDEQHNEPLVTRMKASLL